MYNIIKLDQKIDGFDKLNKLVFKSYKANRKFFDKDIKNLDIAFLYTRDDMDKFCGNKTPEWLVGVSNYSRVVAIFSPSMFEKVSNHPKSDFVPTLTHEIAHAFIHSNYKFKSPAWLSEGIPGYVAKQYKIRPMFRKNLQKFKDIHDIDGWKKTINYPQAYSFTKYLINKFEKKKFLSLISSLGEADSFKTFAKKVRQNLKTSFSNLEKDWLNQIKTSWKEVAP